jgi:two-component system chemotaxis sensor kinase CheA
MSHNDTDLTQEFATESLEHLSDVERRLLDIEAAGANLDVELVNTVFRAVHSTKGAAGFLGFERISDLSHELENLLNLQRTRELATSHRTTDAMLRAVDCLRGMLHDIEHSNEVDISSHVQELQALASREGALSSEDQPMARQEPSIPVACEDLGERGPTGESAAAKSATSSSPAGGEQSIRVSVAILDRLMTLAGELVLGRNQLLQVVESRDAACLDAVSARIDQITSELQEAVMHSRMQPIGTVFSRFSRVVRDLSGLLGKQCRLVVEGNEVELDKTILEAIGDPLTHLVRNSLDHGVERPEDRVRRGKPASGTIHLTARHQAGKVLISIIDDGAGINTDKVKQKAIAAGILTVEQASEMPEREAMRLIFHPGLSTAEKVSEVSGRGVGMDVVRTNIEKIGGAVDVESRSGAGTTIQVQLPLTLAIIPSLIVHVGDERFAIPQNHIVELVRVKAGESAVPVEQINGREVLRLRGRLLPLLRLRDTLAAGSAASTDTVDAMNVIVVEADQLRYGLAVDGLHDSEEIVVKPLGRHLKNCRCLAGATVLGDGRVALILDVAGIAGHSHLSNSNAGTSNEEDQNKQPRHETQPALLFTNAADERFAVPMAVIRRIERIRADQLEMIGEKEFLTYRDSSLPLISMHRHLRVKPRPNQQRLSVLVFEFEGRELGLIVPNILDIVELSTGADTATLREPGVIGSVVIDRKATRIIDVFELAGLAHPELARAAARSSGAAGRKSRILLAEDSEFFRRQVTVFLESHGHETVGCEDGQAAWDELNESPEPYDLVVTDVEMPRLNGFELCRRIKDEERFTNLPVIALTSLAGQEDVDRGSAAGVDEYQVKMDCDQLLGAVSRLLKEASREHRRPALVAT